MQTIRQYEFAPVEGLLGSLSWTESGLVDFGAGIIRYDNQGRGKRGWAGFPCDQAIHCHKGDYTVLFDSLGTKGIVFKGNDIVREINRSYYHAGTYEYPIALFERFDGTVVIAHCPEKYNRLEIEEVETGRRLSARDTESVDFFHSQLRASPDGRYLVSSGWVWQPFALSVIFNLVAAQAQPALLDRNEKGIPGIKACEIASAEFLDATRVVYVGDGDEQDFYLGIYDIAAEKTLSEIQLADIAGVLMPVGDFVVDFFDHPKLIEIATGKVVHHWNDIPSGRRYSCLMGHLKDQPRLALDPQGKRFAVGTKERIVVVELG